MFKKLLITTIALSTIWITAGCQKKATQPEMPPLPVIITAVGTEDVTPSDSYTGKLNAATKATITARVNGYLEKRLVNEGDRVKKDQVIFTIEKTQYIAQVEQAQAALAQAKANAYNSKLQKDRAEALLRSASISQSQYDNANAADAVAQANVEAAEAALAAAKLNLQYTNVTSPIDGKIGFINFNIGETVGPSSGQITTIIADDPMYVIFAVSDKQIQDLRKRYGIDESMNMTEAFSKHADLQLVLSDNSVYKYTGIINFTDNAMVADTGSLRMRGVFANPAGQLLQGQTVTVRLQSKTKVNNIVIPQIALLTDLVGKYVLAVDNDSKVQRKNVNLGAIIDSKQIVISGLNVGDRIIIDGLQKVRIGQTVNPMTQNEYNQMMESKKNQPQAQQPNAGGK